MDIANTLKALKINLGWVVLNFNTLPWKKQVEIEKMLTDTLWEIQARD